MNFKLGRFFPVLGLVVITIFGALLIFKPFSSGFQQASEEVDFQTEMNESAVRVRNIYDPSATTRDIVRAQATVDNTSEKLYQARTELGRCSLKGKWTLGIVIGFMLTMTLPLLSLIRNFPGAALIGAGVVVVLYFYMIFDNSVATNGGSRVVNLGLMNQQTIGCLIGLTAIITGVMLRFFKKLAKT